MEREYHTLNEGIPAEESRGGNTIGIDTGNNKAWLHLWVGHHKQKRVRVEGKRIKMEVFVGESVHLTRQDALNLIEEIKHRLS